MRTPIHVRPAQPHDLEAICSFQVAMALETEDRALDAGLVRRGVAAALGDPSRGLYRVAELDGVVCGSLFLTKEWSDWRNGFFWWIQSVWVEGFARRKGIYRAMYEDVLCAAREDSDVCGIRLYVEETNEAARQTYQSLGMSCTGYRLYETDFGAS